MQHQHTQPLKPGKQAINALHALHDHCMLSPALPQYVLADTTFDHQNKALLQCCDIVPPKDKQPDKDTWLDLATAELFHTDTAAVNRL